MQIKKQSRQQCRPEFEIGQQIFHCGGSGCGEKCYPHKKENCGQHQGDNRRPQSIEDTLYSQRRVELLERTGNDGDKDERWQADAESSYKRTKQGSQNSGPQTLAPTYVAVLTAIGPGVI